MEKNCLVIMPVSDPEGYAQGHFNRVYQYIIVPACKSAGFMPIRVDDPATTGTASDIIKTIIDCDIAICDLSANNSNALYGFALRYAINLPVAMVKDRKTAMMFDTQEFGTVEYDESLRIDTVQSEIEVLSVALKKIFANKMEVNSLLNRLRIGSTNPTEATNMAAPASQSENAEEKETPLPVISPIPDYVGDPITQQEIDKLKVGDFLFHINYGKGEVITLGKMAKDKVAKVQFDSGSKMLVLMTSGIWRNVNA